MNFEDLKKNTPADLDAKILRLLSKRVGAENAIKKSEALRYLPGVHERQFRMAIKSMQKRGVLIGSTNTDGYFMIATPQEGDCVASELEARAKDLFETASILRKTIREELADAYQVQLL